MWRMVPTFGWQSSAMQFASSNEDEVSFLLANIAHYFAQLKFAKNAKSVQALYLCGESSAIKSINCSGISDSAGSLLAYVFLNESQRTLYLLCIGKADSKDSDMEYCKSTVICIVNERD